MNQSWGLWKNHRTEDAAFILTAEIGSPFWMGPFLECLLLQIMDCFVKRVQMVLSLFKFWFYVSSFALLDCFVWTIQLIYVISTEILGLWISKSYSFFSFTVNLVFFLQWGQLWQHHPSVSGQKRRLRPWDEQF